MRWIYISPHLDDAILSAGGLMYEQVHAGNEVEIWTLVCGFPRDEHLSPIAQSLHAHWGFHSAEEAVHARREEDLRAAEIVGASTVYFDYPDCIYRRGRDGDWLYSDTFSHPHVEDNDLPSQMASTLAKRLKPGDRLVSPLAIGDHVDHVITKRAVEMLVRNVIEELGISLSFYADIPYLLDNPSAITPVEEVMQRKGQKVSRKGLSAWQKAAAAYESQIPLEFESMKKMRKAISKYGRKGIYLWSLP